MGIGASAGGLEALEAFLAAVEPDGGAAYVIVTHQGAARPSLLADILARRSKIPVEAVNRSVRIWPNHAYVASPGNGLVVRDEEAHSVPSDPARVQLPVDQLFRSLAENEGENAIGVVLSGSGTDGTIGVAAIKGASGMVIAQDPDSAKYLGMPTSAIATQLVDYVLPPAAMAAQISRYVKGRYRIPVVMTTGKEDPEASALAHVFSMLGSHGGNDFSSYKKSTVRRRIERRMAVHDLTSLKDYASLLEREPSECESLFRELLISVTSFFRDPDAFAVLEEELRRLVEQKTEGTALRIWCAGCATGEEAYSLAILAKEVLARSKKNVTLQVFATDLDARAVDLARAGRYPEGIAADVSQERLERFFVKEDGGYRIAKSVRELIVFASQNVIKDPPFTKLDVLSCRNLLIYLESDLQRRILALFGYSLRPGGVLYLGTSETISGFEDQFSTLDKRWKVFRRKEAPLRSIPDFPAELPPLVTGGKAHAGSRVLQRGANFGIAAERIMLAAFAPPA